MTPKVMRRRTQRLETRKKRKKHKATTGDMKSSDNSFDSFDGVGVVDVVEALQLKCNGKRLDVLARLIDYGRREYLRKFSLQTRQTSQERGTNCYTMFPPTLPSKCGSS
jgi:hypothetical protein